MYEFLGTYFKMVSNSNDFVEDDDEDDREDEFEYHFRDNMIAQFKQDLYNKIFSHGDQDERGNSFQKRTKISA